MLPVKSELLSKGRSYQNVYVIAICKPFKNNLFLISVVFNFFILESLSLFYTTAICSINNITAKSDFLACIAIRYSDRKSC